MSNEEYEKLKNRRSNLRARIKQCKDPEKASILKTQFDEVIEKIHQYRAENEHHILSEILQQDNANKNDDVKHLIPLESKSEPIDKSEILAIINEVVQSSKVNTPSEPTYYIINLAWSRSDIDDGSKIINMVRDFLNGTNWMDHSSQLSEERGESILTWKYSYDNPEEQANVKSFRICASHLLDTVKRWFPDAVDAEIFGKVQKY